MFRRDILRTLMGTLLAGWLRPNMPSAIGSMATEDANAADEYRKMFGWTKDLPPGDSECLRKAATIEIDDQRIGALVEKARPVLEAIRKAATIDQCRWGDEIVSSNDLGKGRLDTTNIYAMHVTCLSARRLAAAGQGREALDDVFAGMKLAHRIGTGGLLIARILECGGEVMAFQTLGRILPGLDRATIGDLSRRLDDLPPPESASAVIGPESRFILGSLRAKLAEAGPVIERAKWGDLGFDDDETATLQRLTGGDRGRLLDHLDANGPAFAELARRLDLPRPGCRAALDEFAKDERSTHPIVAGFVESAWRVRHVVDRMRAIRAILRAGIALVRDGELAFRAEHDPFGNGAFSLERRENGYLIRSALSGDAQPEVKLQIGD